MTENPDSKDGFPSSTPASSSYGSISGTPSRKRRGKKSIFVSGSVSNIRGKESASSSNNRIGVSERNVSAAFQKVQAWEALPDFTEPTSEDAMAMFGTSSYYDLQDGDMRGNARSYASILGNWGTRPPSGFETSSEQLTQEKSPKDELELYNWKDVVKNKSYRYKPDNITEDKANKEQFTGDDYQNCRSTASQYWNSSRALRGQADFARENDRWDEANDYDNQARMLEKNAQQADERASQDIFDSRNMNRGIKNQMKIDLRDQPLREGMKKLKHHLIFGVYQRSLWQLQVITGYGSHGTRASVLKQSVADLLKAEDIKWQEKNKGSLLITFDGRKRELGFVECEDDDCEDGFSNSTYTSSSNLSSASSSNGSSGSMSSRSRRKKVISVSGSVSNIMGKRIGVEECNVPAAVDKVQAWNAMPDLTEPRSEDVTTMFETSSNNDLQEGDTSSMGGNARSYGSVLGNYGTRPPSGPETSSEHRNQDMSEALNALEKGLRDALKRELDRELDNRKNVVTNELRRHLPGKVNVDRSLSGDDYQNQSITASQYRDSAKALKEKVKFACANGKREDAKYYEDQARMFEKMAQQEDDRASQDIFDSRNKGIKNRMEIDLHGQHWGEGMKILKDHLKFGVYERSLWQLRVITGYGSHGTGPSVQKHSVANLLQNEKMKWQEEEENPGCLLITFDGQKRELDFVNCRR